MSTTNLYTTADAAAHHAVSERTIQRIAQTRGVGRMLGRQRVFTRRELEKLKPAPVGRPPKNRKRR